MSNLDSNTDQDLIAFSPLDSTMSENYDGLMNHSLESNDQDASDCFQIEIFKPEIDKQKNEKEIKLFTIEIESTESSSSSLTKNLLFASSSSSCKDFLMMDSEHTKPTSNINPLHFQVKKLQKLLALEQDKFSRLNKKLNESESQRLELISQTNKEIFGLNAQLAKLRSDFEKCQVVKEQLEYQLAMAKNSVSKEKQNSSERDQATKKLEEQVKKLSKENTELKLKLESQEIEMTKKQADLNQVTATLNDQEKQSASLKEENSFNKEIIVKMRNECESAKEELIVLRRDVQKLEKDKSEIEKDADAKKSKCEELESRFNECHRKKTELEESLTKADEQIKKLRKELDDEQSRFFEQRDKSKTREAQLSQANSELAVKLEEKSNKIKDLSDQINLYELNLNVIKQELKDTKIRQAELDQVYKISTHEIQRLVALLSFKEDDPEYEQFVEYQKRRERAASREVHSTVSLTLTYYLSYLKTTVEDFKRYFSYKLKELEKYKCGYEKLKLSLNDYEARLNESKSQLSNSEKDVQLLRMERKAFEELVDSLKFECENLRLSLTQEQTGRDQLKMQVNFLFKRVNDLEENAEVEHITSSVAR